MDKWLTYSPVSGHGNATITLSASTLTGLEDRVATLIATGSQEGQTLSATTVITQKYLILTEIYFENLTWSTDIYWGGGTATSANCSFSIIAKYSDNSTKDITNLANVTGSLAVPATTATTRQSVGTLTLTATYEDKTCTGNVEVYQEAFDPLKELLTFKITSDGYINWATSSRSAAKTIQYKLNDGNWVSIRSNTGSTAPKINVVAGDKIQFRGDNATYGSSSSYYSAFKGSTAGFEVEGNIMSLINPTDFSTLTTLESGFTFVRLFSDCTGLTSAENLILPATTLKSSCYSSMFYGCTSLATAPVLPSTTLTPYCYGSMFDGCASLTTAPALPATKLSDNCYESMFNGCTSLTAAPELPVTTLENSCYDSMFQGCTSLTTAPVLPATTLATYCYNQMFYNCSSLTTTPELPATTLAFGCYKSMFQGCASLTTAPELPATTLTDYCYDSMFYGCTSLATAPVLPATTLTDYCYSSMFQNCTSLITAPVLPATTLANGCYSSMFYGCTSLTTAPSILPSTTLVQNCYAYMFYGCSSLTTAPELPARTLLQYSYAQMFYECTSLNYIKCLATDIYADRCAYYWVYGVGSNGTFVKDENMTSWKTGDSGIPTGWAVVNNS